MTTLNCTQVGTTQRPPSEILNGQCCHIHRIILKLPIRLLPILSSESLREQQHYTDDEALQNATCQWVQRRDSEFYQAGTYTLVQRRMLPKMETMLENNYVFSNLVEKFCEIFTLSNL
jgi:hypothetical protein